MRYPGRGPWSQVISIGGRMETWLLIILSYLCAWSQNKWRSFIKNWICKENKVNKNRKKKAHRQGKKKPTNKTKSCHFGGHTKYHVTLWKLSLSVKTEEGLPGVFTSEDGDWAIWSYETLSLVITFRVPLYSNLEFTAMIPTRKKFTGIYTVDYLKNLDVSILIRYTYSAENKREG